MNTPVDPAAVDPVVAVERISDELTAITSRLQGVSAEVASLRSALGAPARMAPQAPASAAAPAPTPQVQYATTPPPQPFPPQPIPPQPFGTHQPYPQQLGGPAPYRPYIPAAPKPAMRDRLATAGEGGLIGKVLALAGVGITLIGVVLLLVLAAQAGLLSPPLRVAGGALLAVALVAGGLWIGRRENKRTGAAALVATGIAAGLLDVLAAANLYHWLPMIAALILVAVIAAGGFAIAAQWRNQSLAVTIGVALVVLAPFLTHGFTITLIVFLLVYAAATLSVQLGRNWTALFAVNTVATSIPILLFPLFHYSSTQSIALGIAAVACFVLALGSALLLLRSRTSSASVITTALFTLVPVLASFALPSVLDDNLAAAIIGGIAAVLLLVGFLGAPIPGVTDGVRTVWLTGGAVALVFAIGMATSGEGATVALAGIPLVLGLASFYAGGLARNLRILATVALGFALAALLYPSVRQLLNANQGDTDDRLLLLASSALALTSLAVVAWTWLRADERRNHVLVIVAGLIGLALTNVLLVTLGALVTNGSDGGFRAGHMCATIAFAAAGAGALIWARRLRGTDRAVTLAAGLAVIAVAVVKLFAFDLAALDGLFRVIAFIVVGLVLLGLGVVYAQSLSNRE